ncbi:MAG: fumarylacetoacetate hydrolase family protein [Snodgrassella sp.]|nr:fumarylacetoacetate hydrolase family protein [Snodgrassella sp.]
MKKINLAGQEVFLGNIFCIGRNYLDHVKELKNANPSEPVVFLKPSSALIQTGEMIRLPDFSQDVHHECELVVYIKKDAFNVTQESAMDHIGGYAIGLDLTARDIQNQLKSKGLPWTKAKGFPTSACLSHFISPEEVENINAEKFYLNVNGQTRQQGNTEHMMFSCAYIISYLSRIYGLQAGDIIYTGTPAGVAAIQSGDELELILSDKISTKFSVA